MANIVKIESFPKRVEHRFVAASALGALVACGCGGPSSSDQSENQVQLHSSQVIASPAGHTFLDRAEVVLAAEGASEAPIFFTLDGSPATSESAQRYRGPIELRETAVLNFIALLPSGHWTEPGTELYVEGIEALATASKPRWLLPDRRSVFLAFRPGDQSPMVQRVVLRSAGTQAVQVRSLEVGVNPRGWSFWEAGAFAVNHGPVPVQLAPGESMTLEVVYQPTDTLRSAAIFISSDDQSQDGQTLIELWGRRSPW